MNRSDTPPSAPAAPAAAPQALQDQQLDEVTAGTQRQQSRQVTVIQDMAPVELLLTSDGSVPGGRVP